MGPDKLVGVCMQRSIDLVVALHATVKAGGAYVPLDPDYPRHRLEFVLHDARPPVVLTDRASRHLLPDVEATVLCVDGDDAVVAFLPEPSTSEPVVQGQSIVRGRHGQEEQQEGCARNDVGVKLVQGLRD